MTDVTWQEALHWLAWFYGNGGQLEMTPWEQKFFGIMTDRYEGLIDIPPRHLPTDAQQKKVVEIYFRYRREIVDKAVWAL